MRRTTGTPLRFEIGAPSSYDSVDTNVSQTSSDIQPRSTITLKGGTTINNSSAWFTLGFCGKYHSLDAFVTCGHGQDTSAWTLTGGTIGSGDTLGGVSYLRYQNNGNGDFSIHTIASGLPNTVTLTNKIQNVSDSGADISVTGIYSDPPVGTYLFKYNATTTTTAATKYRSYCEVTTVGLTLLSDNELYLRNMTQAKFVSSVGSSIPGDSGGPVFVLNGSTWQIAGVHSGSSGTEYVNFTPWKYISAAGFTAKTS